MRSSGRKHHDYQMFLVGAAVSLLFPPIVTLIICIAVFVLGISRKL